GARIEGAIRSQQGLRVPPLERVARGEALPLSFAQQRLWFLAQLEPESSVYHIPIAFRFAGTLDLGALEQTLTVIVRRHEVLRTRFEEAVGEPVQVIDPPAAFPLRLVDLGGLDSVAQQAAGRRWAREEAARPFDLSRGPLFRALLLRLGEADYVFLATMHHIISDGWSMEIMRSEVAELYPAFAQRRSWSLPELPVQYADFAVWQRRWLQGEVLEVQLGYWKERLAGAPALLELPTDRPRPALAGYRGASWPVEVRPGLARQLHRLSRQHDATLFMTLMAAFQALLYRHTMQEDVCVGTPIAGRHFLELEDLIGFFVNTLVVRGNLGGDPELGAFLDQVRETFIEASAHQDL
ncbi:MAG: non-ribosomal peptide synthetase, partial [bacterium]|nr:non-ribosomal peptide synthetase [bacterium]